MTSEKPALFIHTLSPAVFRMLLNLVMVTDPWPLNDSENTTFIDWMNHESQLWGFPSWVEAYHQFKLSDALEAEMFRDSRLFRASLIDVPADKSVSQQDVTTAIDNLLVSVGQGDVVAVEAYLDLSARLAMRWIHTRIERGRNVVAQIEAFEEARSSDEAPAAPADSIITQASRSTFTFRPWKPEHESREEYDAAARYAFDEFLTLHFAHDSEMHVEMTEAPSRGSHKQRPMPQGMKLVCIRCNKTPGEIQEYIDTAGAEGMTPDEYVWEEEGTLNRENGHFLCTTDYVAAGMPSTPGGWVAP